jgi:hypothetical protein
MSKRFEQTDISSGLVARAGAYLALTLGIVFLMVYVFLHMLGGKSPAPQVTGPEAPTPEWGEPVPANYRWLDGEHKIISIPIERAIEVTAERGLPARPKP